MAGRRFLVTGALPYSNNRLHVGHIAGAYLPADIFTRYARLAGHDVLYISAHEMLTQLRAARADASYDRKLLRFTSAELLVIDDLGLRPLTGEEPIDLYEIVRRRYERASTIITSNRALPEWAPLFKDELLASAALDRLLHHCHVVEITGSSYRNPPRDRGGKGRPS